MVRNAWKAKVCDTARHRRLVDAATSIEAATQWFYSLPPQSFVSACVGAYAWTSLTGTFIHLSNDRYRNNSSFISPFGLPNWIPEGRGFGELSTALVQPFYASSPPQSPASATAAAATATYAWTSPTDDAIGFGWLNSKCYAQ